MQPRLALVSSGVAVLTLALVAPSGAPAATAPKAGASCKAGEVGKRAGNLVCRAAAGGRRWTKTAATKTAATKAAPTTARGSTPATAGPSTTTDAAPAPRRGGKLVFGNTTESVNGYTPQLATLGPSGQLVRSLMIETITQPTPDGDIRCWLCESITANSSYTEWTIRLRPNISFHDNTPLDAAAVKLNLDEGRKPTSATISALRGVTSVDVVDPLTVRVHVDEPWVSFPANLDQQAGAIVAPSQLRDPQGRRRPVGTGPFKFEEWVLNDHLSLVRNDNYWRKGLPYLDEITVRAITEESSRIAALQSGEIDAMITSTGQTVADLRDLAAKGKIRSTEALKFASVNNIALNNLAGPTADPRVRKALQLATDRAVINKVVQGDTHKLADSPFGQSVPESSKAYWPKPDTAKARALIDQVQAQTGKPVDITLTTSTGADSVGQAELLQSMWRAIGVNVKINVIEGGSGTILQRGQYQAMIAGPLLSSVDPDEMRRYFYSDDTPVGQLSGNWTRTSSAIIDAAFDQIRSNSDPAVRARAADAINREIADQAYTLLTTQAIYATGTSTKVAFARPTLPDGTEWWPFPTGITPLAFAYRT